MSRRSHSLGSGLPATRPRPRQTSRGRRLVPSTRAIRCLNRYCRVRTRRGSLYMPHSTCRHRVLIRTIRPIPRCQEDPPRRRTTTGWLGSTREVSNNSKRLLSPRSRALVRPQHWHSRPILHIPLDNPCHLPLLFQTSPLHLQPLHRPLLRRSVPRTDRSTHSRSPRQLLVARSVPQLDRPLHATTPSRMARDRGPRRLCNLKPICLALRPGYQRQPRLMPRQCKQRRPHRAICRRTRVVTRVISSMCRLWLTEPINSSHIALWD
jgi:hypothetical protein